MSRPTPRDIALLRAMHHSSAPIIRRTSEPLGLLMTCPPAAVPSARIAGLVMDGLLSERRCLLRGCRHYRLTDAGRMAVEEAREMQNSGQSRPALGPVTERSTAP